MASKLFQNITRESGFFYASYPLSGISSRTTSYALARSNLSGGQRHTLKQIELTAGHWRVTARQKNLSQTKIALHRTRLRFLDHENFSFLFFFKPDRQPAPLLAALGKTRTEKIEKNFSAFTF
ncbi:hypothetical protein LL024_06965 [Enterobacter ludwigii]|uniref:hypothetical protein n=1 Tax=Enterobacter ludwigii TaxID=299767 RepID=UPI001D1733E4|nr:hypothetical protein [Enterobacter ludwigii]UEG34522.1 hypothetical protein LL022_06980 [Enterobacter ludwigii]UEG36569.1 hypothetical protein LL023_16760 [Enterobacter ludwigii]UEG43208.1 hypothetical protein LL024_06965 [Enterobacter ludwigii]